MLLILLVHNINHIEHLKFSSRLQAIVPLFSIESLSKTFVTAHPQVPWRDIADMRHHLVHGYYQVDSNIVWAVVHNDPTPLREQVASILSNTNWEDWEKK